VRRATPAVAVHLDAVPTAELAFEDHKDQMPSVWALASAGQGMEAFAAAARANVEIQAAMRNLNLAKESRIIVP